MNISFLAGSGGPSYEWADPDLDEGIGGSEECLMFLARALAKLGHRARVYNNCGSKAGIYHDVVYIPHVVEPYPGEDLLVAWRNWYLLVGKNAGQKWMWSHDFPVGCHAPSEQDLPLALEQVDQWVLLNPYHAGLYGMLPAHKRLIIPIGVNVEAFGARDAEGKAIERVRGRVLYFSEPARGLNVLRGLWREIKYRVPHAELAAFWWDESKFYPPDEALGILPMRHLGPKEVAIETRRAEIMAYPSTFAGEISPATCLKSQVGGAIPVVVMQGGMVDAVQFGVKTDYQHFAKELCDLLVDEDRQEKIRKEMLVMRNYSSWDAIAAMWVKEMQSRL